jgi:glycosyltransferase involved in cell wall biosynthesis
VVLALSKGLAARGLALEAIFPEAKGETSARFLADAMGAAMETSTAVRDFRLSRNLHHLLALYRLVRSKKARVVNIHFGNSRISFWDTLAIRLAGTHRCFASVHHASPFEGIRDRFATKLSSLLCSRVVVTTPALTKILVEAGVSQRKIIEIPLGLSQPASLPSQHEARKLLGLPADALVIGSLGRLVPTKGFDDLITAVALIPQEARAIHLVIGGEGPLEGSLRELAHAKLGTCAHVLGRIDNPSLLYSASDLFSLASHEEGFGLVFIEAALHGVPSVAPNVGGIAYAIAHGQTGIVVAHRDLNALANAMRSLLHDEKGRRRMGEAARERAIRKFNVYSMVDQYRNLLFQTIG